MSSHPGCKNPPAGEDESAPPVVTGPGGVATKPRNPLRARAFTAGGEVLDGIERYSSRTIPRQSQYLTQAQSKLCLLEEPMISESKSGKSTGRKRQESSISNAETITHLLKGNIGIGILTLPIAISNAGLLFGTFGLAFMSFICVYCMSMLVSAAQRACKRREDCEYLDYADTAEAAFEDAGGCWKKCAATTRKVLNVLICIMQICAVYVLFMAQNLQPILVSYGGIFFLELNYRYYILMLLLPMVLACFIRNLRYLSPFSILASIIQAVGIGIIFYYIFHEPLPHSSSVPWIASVDKLPLFFGTAIFAIEGITIVLPIENQMRRPKDMLGYNGVLFTSMVVVTALYLAMGFYGYLKYGNNVKSTITLNLPPDDKLAQSVLVLYCIAIFFSYLLQFYVLMDIFGPNVVRPNVPERWYSMAEYLSRVVLNVLIFAVAASVPWLDLLVSLLGSVKMSILSIMAPVLIDTASNWDNLGRFKWKLVRNFSIFLFGFFGMLIGSYVSTCNIVNKFKAEE